MPPVEMEWETRLAIGAQQNGDTADQWVDNIAIDAVAGSDDAMPITLGQTVSGTILLGGAVDRYAFDITTPSRIVFDGLTSSPGNLAYAISGPGGAVDSAWFDAGDSGSRGGDNVLALAPAILAGALPEALAAFSSGRFRGGAAA